MFEPMVSILSDSRWPLVCGCLGNGMVAFQYCNFRVPNGLLHGGWRGYMVVGMVAYLYGTATFKYSMVCCMEILGGYGS